MKRRDKSERVKLGFWKRLQWIFSYYTLPILAGVAVLAVAGYILYINLRPQRDVILNVTMINANPLAESDLFDDYLDRAGYNIAEETAFVNNTIEINFDGTDAHAWDYYQVVTAQMLMGEIDLFIADGELFTSFADYNAFLDVSEYLTPEQLEQNAERILYVTDSDTGEQMPCGIILDETSPIVQAGYYYGNCYLGVCTNYYHDEETLKVLALLLEDLA